jgi:diguanylate cyclase (GGDEF)-like protein
LTGTQTRQLVLLADDDPTIRIIGAEYLTAAGFDVACAADGREALARFEERRPAAVILDVQMPNIDGYVVCETLRRDGHHDVPILIATGQDDTAGIHRAYEAGATDFIGKPVNWAVLPYRLRYVLRASALREALLASQRRTQTLLEAIPDEIFLLDANGEVCEQINGQRGSHAAPTIETPRSIEDLLPPKAARVTREHLHGALSTGQTSVFEYESHDRNVTHEARLVPQSENAVMMIVRDVTERRRSEERIRQLAYFDSVTGLPNRQLLVRELRRSIRQAKRTGGSVAVLYVDLDRFKRINDTFGHSVGDALLKSVATRLSGCVRPLDFLAIRSDGALPERATRIARLGGDEFVVLLTDLDAPEEAGAVAKRIRQTLSAPFTYEGRQFVVTPSIGVALYPRDGHDVETLLMRADTAMYQAKDARNTVRFYVSDMDMKALDRLRMEEELRQAIDQRQLALHYQPKHSLQNGAVTGAEALIRWRHPERGWVSPGEFIPLAEETGLIVPLGEWVLDEACRQLQAWQTRGLKAFRLAINISSEQVSRSDVANMTLKSVWAHGVRPQLLELEITETLLMQDTKSAKEMMLTLKDAGVSLAVDDFGTGYSSLAYLRQLPLDALKIDRSFVQNIHSVQDDAVICEAIVAMGKKLGLTVVAEGVELEEQHDFLRSAGCDQAQGFFFSRPLPADELERYLVDSAVSRTKDQAATRSTER